MCRAQRVVNWHKCAGARAQCETVGRTWRGRRRDAATTSIAGGSQTTSTFVTIEQKLCTNLSLPIKYYDWNAFNYECSTQLWICHKINSIPRFMSVPLVISKTMSWNIEATNVIWAIFVFDGLQRKYSHDKKRYITLQNEHFINRITLRQNNLA